MILVDSCGWIEYFGEGRLASAYAPALKTEQAVLIPAIVVYEVTKWIMLNMPSADLSDILTVMLACEIADFTSDLAVSAAELSIQFNLPMADSIILATALAHGTTIWTHDQHFEGVPHVKFIRLSE